MSGGTGDDAGVAVLELLLWATVFTVILAVVVIAGRVPLVVGQVDQAAKVAAEEAAAHRSKPAALQAARLAAEANLQQDGITCEHLDVALDLSDWQPGGAVHADVSCDVALSEFMVVGVPATVRLDSEFFATIDTHKALS